MKYVLMGSSIFNIIISLICCVVFTPIGGLAMFVLLTWIDAHAISEAEKEHKEEVQQVQMQQLLDQMKKLHK